MRAIIPALLILSPGFVAAQGGVFAPKKKLSAIALLPNGSQLHEVILPRYDENLSLSGILKARTMTLLNEESIAGETVSIEFYNPDRSPRGRADLTQVVFYQGKGILKAAESIIIQTDRISARGAALCYDFEQGEGFLSGPVTTWIQASATTTATHMNSRQSSLRAVGILGVSLISQPVTAAPPTLPHEEIAALRANASSSTAKHDEEVKSVRSNLIGDLEASAAATASAKAFLEKADIVSKGPQTINPVPDAKPLDVQPGPSDTIIECDGGMYFDADEGVFVYLKNVRVTDPRFSLQGANELKIYLGKKPKAASESAPTSGKAKTKEAPSIGLGAKFGDVERIIATGAVRLLQKQNEKGKEPIEASGAIFSYHLKSGEILLSGGFPWVKQGTTFMRAKSPNLTLRILKSGSFVTEGNWDMGGRIDQKP